MRGLQISLVIICLSFLVLTVGLVASDFPQDKHTTQASEWYFQEQSINNALHGKTIKRVWASGNKLVIECDGATFEYLPEAVTRVELLPRGILIRP